MAKRFKRTAGWREWIGLPSFGIGAIKAKLDTGARTSALHAFNVETYWRDGKLWTRFSVHPIQKDDSTAVTCLARVADIRTVSNPGRRQRRLVIRTDVCLGGETWPIDLTLTDRDEMGFRMLLGRTAMHGAMTVDPDHSYLLGKKKRVKRKKKKKKTGKPARKAKATTRTPGKAKAPKRRKKLGRLLQLFT